MLYSDDYIYRSLKGSHRSNAKVNIPKYAYPLIKAIQLSIAICYCIMWLITKIPVVGSIIESISCSYARGNVGFLLRGIYFKTKLRKMGINVFIDRGVNIWDPQFVEIDSNTYIETNVDIYGGLAKENMVTIGKFVHIASGCILAGRAGLTIGDYTGIAAGCKVYSAVHHYKNKLTNEFMITSPMVPNEKQFLIEAAVTIKEHVLIGFNTIVFPGVTLHQGCVIGALSLVKSDVAEFMVGVGSPLRIINERPRPEIDAI